MLNEVKLCGIQLWYFVLRASDVVQKNFGQCSVVCPKMKGYIQTPDKNTICIEAVQSHHFGVFLIDHVCDGSHHQSGHDLATLLEIFEDLLLVWKVVFIKHEFRSIAQYPTV